MVVYSSVNVPGTEFISLNGDPLPSCLNNTEPHVVGDSDIIMRPAVVKNKGNNRTQYCECDPGMKEMGRLHCTGQMSFRI